MKVFVPNSAIALIWKYLFKSICHPKKNKNGTDAWLCAVAACN
jgi:hypothetical protein